MRVAANVAKLPELLCKAQTAFFSQSADISSEILERDEARRIAVTSFCGKPKRKDTGALFCAAHLVLNTLVDEFGALVEW